MILRARSCSRWCRNGGKGGSRAKAEPGVEPQVDKLDFNEGQPLKSARCSKFYRSFGLGTYKRSGIENAADGGNGRRCKQGAGRDTGTGGSVCSVEGRAVENGDFAQLKLLGTPANGGRTNHRTAFYVTWAPKRLWNRLNTSLRGATSGTTRIRRGISEDYPRRKTDRKEIHYAADVTGIKSKKLPELNDEFPRM